MAVGCSCKKGTCSSAQCSCPNTCCAAFYIYYYSTLHPLHLTWVEVDQAAEGLQKMRGHFFSRSTAAAGWAHLRTGAHASAVSAARWYRLAPAVARYNDHASVAALGASLVLAAE